MALVTRSAEMPDVQGKQGGEIHRHDACGDHIQSYPRLINSEPSSKQRMQRNSFRKCRQFWIDNMTWEGAAYWQQYANRHPSKSRKGTTSNLTAWQQFLKLNLVRVRNGLEPEPLPPEN